MAQHKHPDQEKAAKAHRETGSPGEGISFSPYRNPPYQYEATLAETESKEAATQHSFSAPDDENLSAADRG